MSIWGQSYICYVISYRACCAGENSKGGSHLCARLCRRVDPRRDRAVVFGLWFKKSTSQSTRATELNGVGQYVGDQWTAALVRMAGFHVLYMVVYLETGVGLGGPNFQRLQCIADVIVNLNVQFIAIGDWNEPPQALIDIEWA